MKFEDSEYLERLYRDNYSKLFLHAYGILGRSNLAEVAVQDAYVIACNTPGKLTGSENPIGWMMRVVEHTSLHIQREHRRTAALCLSMEELERGKEFADLSKSASELKERCLKAVSEEDFTLFWRIAMEGCSFVEEARRLGISLAACYKRFERLRARLRQALWEDNEA